MTDPSKPIIVAQCPLCPFRWFGPMAKVAAQRHATKTGHPVEVTTTTTMPVEMGQ